MIYHVVYSYKMGGKDVFMDSLVNAGDEIVFASDIDALRKELSRHVTKIAGFPPTITIFQFTQLKGEKHPEGGETVFEVL